MLHSLSADLFVSYLPLAIGVAALFLGRYLPACPKFVQASFALLSAGIIAMGIAALAGILPFTIQKYLSIIGGGTIVMAWSSLILVGFASNSRRRKVSAGFLFMLASIAAVLLLLEGSGRIWWRYFTPELWHRTADGNGALVQSSGYTCAPTAGVMLLHHYGISASEGEMAYLTNTTLLGTDCFGLARGLTEKVKDCGHVRVDQVDYETCLRLEKPFVALVWRHDIGGHAIFVQKSAPNHVEIIDPLNGNLTRISRDAFENMWDGTAVWIDGSTE